MFKDRWKGILEAAEIEVHDDVHSTRRRYRLSETVEERRNAMLREGISPQEMEARMQYSRTRALSRVVEALRLENLPPPIAGRLADTAKFSDEGGKSEADFDRFLRMLESRMSCSREVHTPNALAFSAMLCEELFAMVETEKRGDDPDNPYTPLHAIADRLKAVSSRLTYGVNDEYELVAKHVKKYADLRNTADRQYAGIYGTATTIWQEFTTSEVRNAIYFGCEPLRLDELIVKGVEFVNFTKHVETDSPDLDDEPGVFYVYQPDPQELDNLTAKACKVMFFESIIGSTKRAQHGEDMPLAAYVADEFQRFITADRVHGEQSFLDVCRSFGAFTVIACQSIASLRYALCNVESDESKRASAIDIICNNTATKIFFRTTDKDTADRLNTICPSMPGGVVVTKVRPLSTLAPGECYASFPDGRFERVQLDSFGFPV